MYLLVQFAIYIHTHTQSLVGGEIFCCLFNQSYISNCRTLIRYLSQYQTDWDGISHAFMHSLTGREDRFRAYISAALTIALGFWKFVLRRAQNQCHALTGKQGFGSQKTICVSLKERKKKAAFRGMRSLYQLRWRSRCNMHFFYHSFPYYATAYSYITITGSRPGGWVRSNQMCGFWRWWRKSLPWKNMIYHDESIAIRR